MDQAVTSMVRNRGLIISVWPGDIVGIAIEAFFDKKRL
jgi:hypothetical protein